MLTLEAILLGLIMGVFYGLMAFGLTLIFGILKVVHFAHGESFMIGAYAYTLLALWLGVPLWLAIPCAILIGGVVGVVVERLLIRPLYEKFGDWQAMRDEYAIIVTFGLSLFLVNLANQLFGPYPFRGPDLTSVARFEIGPLIIGGQRLVAGAVGVVVLVAAYLFVQHSFWGKQIRAVAQNRFGAAIAGALRAPLFAASPDVGVLPALKWFAIVVLGGMGSPLGSLVGGLILGVLESMGALYISYTYRDTYAFVILILVLLLRPQGLFGERPREV